MASWSRRERVVTTVEFRIPANEPWGAPWNEVENAIGMAVKEYQRLTARNPGDDSIRIHAEDDMIVVSFVKEEDDHA